MIINTLKDLPTKKIIKNRILKSSNLCKTLCSGLVMNNLLEFNDQEISQQSIKLATEDTLTKTVTKIGKVI